MRVMLLVFNEEKEEQVFFFFFSLKKTESLIGPLISYVPNYVY